MEHINKPNEPLNLESYLSDFRILEFYFFRENSARRTHGTVLSSNDSFDSLVQPAETPKKDTDEINTISEFSLMYMSKSYVFEYSLVPFKIGMN